MRNIGLVLVVLLSFSNLQARDWKKVKIPGAKCGNGTAYKVWIDQRSEDKLLIEFMGGGVCWSLTSCYGPRFRTILQSLPRPIPSVVASEKDELTPFTKHSMIYFPYCNGDVFAGKHIKKYSFGKVYHQGFLNVQKALKHLKKKNLIKFSEVDDLVLYGASAGGIATLIHSKTVDPYVDEGTKKTIIADSPGMHFGETFWDKFTDEMNADIMSSLNRVNLYYDLNEGFLSPYVGNVCKHLNDWNIGILQGAQDVVMSLLFGNISMAKHKELVFGPKGLYEMTQDLENCASWTPDTKMHTFLLLKKSSLDITPQGMNAMNFAQDIYLGNMNNSYTD